MTSLASRPRRMIPAMSFIGKPSMVEEILVTGTQVIQVRFTIWRVQESVLGALSVAGEFHRTVYAVSRQGIPFI